MEKDQSCDVSHKTEIKNFEIAFLLLGQSKRSGGTKTVKYYRFFFGMF